MNPRIQLALATGADIPLLEISLILHQPNIRDISMLGESEFFTALATLCLDKEQYQRTNPNLIFSGTSFDIFMMLMNDRKLLEKKQQVTNALELIFPSANFSFTPRSLMINQNGINSIIDEESFPVLQEYLTEIFCLDRQKSKEIEYNPGNEKAREIAEKLKKARARVAQIKSEASPGSVIGQYLSILTVGLRSMSLKDCCDLTLYQLYDLIERYTLYTSWDIDTRARMAGAKIDRPTENWMKNIHQK